MSCPARGMGVEIFQQNGLKKWESQVMPREGHGSRNARGFYSYPDGFVMPREGHGSRNFQNHNHFLLE